MSLDIHKNINSKEDIPESSTFFVDYVMNQIIGCNKQTGNKGLYVYIFISICCCY